ncbi:MAG TPA: F0F1 ATP synthase subunit alpha [Sandaracinaceae bacterium]
MADPSLGREIERVSAALARAARAYVPAVREIEEGRILSVGDGVATIAGLRGAGAEELVEIAGGARALVLGVEPARLSAVVLDDERAIRRGARVRRIGGEASLLVGPELVGRVIDPLGRPLDGEPLAFATGEPMPLERRAPRIHERASVHRPLHTGVLALDAMLPIGRGQRELILGDEGTGKTSLALDVIAAQRDVISIYVAIGRRRAETWRAVEAMRKMPGRFVVVAAPEDASPGLRYLAPYAGCAVAEYFVERGEHALVVYDDLTSHAVAWRELALLMRRPPGREAFPGDVFYLHARLLERATQLGPDRGGGSLTALPIARLESGRLSAYLPTNLISITDGQIVLSQALFAAGQLPAIDVSLSVSRIGGKAQPVALRELAAKLRLEYASFLELEVFSRIGARLEASVERRLARGRRLRALLRQGRFRVLDRFDEVVQLVLASDAERFARVPEADVPAVAEKVCREVRASEPAIAEALERDPVLGAEERARLAAAIAAVLDRAYPPEGGRG